MKFACAGCHAQYMISDEKVGPRGVRVRCKKCDHVNVVRRPAPATDPDAMPAQTSAPRPAASLDEELGAAFASVTGEGPAADETEPPADDVPPVEKTTIISSPELQRIFDARADAPAAQAPSQEPEPERAQASASGDLQWYLAIDDEQIGPLSFDAVRDSWDKGEIGPDTLCWRTGMADWAPLSQIAELADVLAPRPSAKAPEGDWLQAAMEPREAPAGAFQPSAAQALRDLVEAEREAAEKQVPAEATLEKDLAGPESTGVRDLLAGLPKPEAPPQELSRLIPIGTPAKKPAAAPPPEKKEAAGLGKWVGVAAALVLLVAGGAWATGLLSGGTQVQSAPVAAAPTPQPPPAPEPPAAPPAPEPTKKPEEEKVAAGAGGAGGTTDAMAEADEGKGGSPEAVQEEPEEKVAEAPEKKAEPQMVAAAAPQPKPKKAAPKRRPRQQRKAVAQRAEPRPTPTSTSKKSLLDAAGSGNSIDSLFEREFSQPGGSTAQRSGGGGAGYIPPAPGGGGKPHQLSQGDIAGVVVGHKGALKTCADRYKSSSGQSGGTVVMRWTIRPNGTTTGVRPVRGGEHAELATCIGDLVKGWKFPAYSGPQMAPIDFPFQF